MIIIYYYYIIYIISRYLMIYIYIYGSRVDIFYRYVGLLYIINDPVSI